MAKRGGAKKAIFEALDAHDRGEAVTMPGVQGQAEPEWKRRMREREAQNQPLARRPAPAKSLPEPPSIEWGSVKTKRGKKRAQRKAKAWRGKVQGENARMDAQTGGAKVTFHPSPNRNPIQPDIPAPWE